MDLIDRLLDAIERAGGLPAFLQQTCAATSITPQPHGQQIISKVVLMNLLQQGVQREELWGSMMAAWLPTISPSLRPLPTPSLISNVVGDPRPPVPVIRLGEHIELNERFFSAIGDSIYDVTVMVGDDAYHGLVGCGMDLPMHLEHYLNLSWGREKPVFLFHWCDAVLHINVLYPKVCCQSVECGLDCTGRLPQKLLGAVQLVNDSTAPSTAHGGLPGVVTAILPNSACSAPALFVINREKMHLDEYYCTLKHFTAFARSLLHVPRGVREPIVVPGPVVKHSLEAGTGYIAISNIFRYTKKNLTVVCMKHPDLREVNSIREAITTLPLHQYYASQAVPAFIDCPQKSDFSYLGKYTGRDILPGVGLTPQALSQLRIGLITTNLTPFFRVELEDERLLEHLLSADFPGAEIEMGKMLNRQAINSWR